MTSNEAPPATRSEAKVCRRCALDVVDADIGDLGGPLHLRPEQVGAADRPVRYVARERKGQPFGTMSWRRWIEATASCETGMRWIGLCLVQAVCLVQIAKSKLN